MRNLLSGIDFDKIDIEASLENSYRDFHAKGLDYVCLQRSPELTIKAYFFEDMNQKPGEVINPHDHRYAFDTQCFSGVVQNRLYRSYPVNVAGLTKGYYRFEWRTPLNGGDGFNWAGYSVLENHETRNYHAGQSYFMWAHELHTIKILRPETVIVLKQHADVVPLDKPTYTYALDAEPPSLKGLYREFKADELVARINLLKELSDGF